MKTTIRKTMREMDEHTLAVFLRDKANDIAQCIVRGGTLETIAWDVPVVPEGMRLVSSKLVGARRAKKR